MIVLSIAIVAAAFIIAVAIFIAKPTGDDDVPPHREVSPNGGYDDYGIYRH